MKVKKILLFLFLLLVPTQLGKHFWITESYLQGIRIDYLSPTLFLVDLLWLGWVVSELKNRKLIKLKTRKKTKLIIGLVIILNIVLATSPIIALYRWVRILQGVMTICLLKNKKELVKKYLVKIVPIWFGLEFVLGLSQFVGGKSIEGFFYFLGERRMNLNTIGIAKLEWFGQERMRAYGTFSHPNSLAGFVLVALVLWNGLVETSNKWIRLGVNIVALVVIGLSGSRTVWLLSVGYCLYVLINEFRIIKLLKISILIAVLLVWGTLTINNNYILGWDSESLGKRIELLGISWEIINQSPIVGVGLGNFIYELPKYNFSWRQPVHNIFVLWLIETGFLGLVALYFGLIKKIDFRGYGMVFLMILVTGILDHYWLTLNQNWWLLVIVVVLSSKIRVNAQKTNN